MGHGDTCSDKTCGADRAVAGPRDGRPPSGHDGSFRKTFQRRKPDPRGTGKSRFCSNAIFA